MMLDIKKIVCFGEILWDVFPDSKVIGGAPLNVALRLQSQGHDVAMISCIGSDEAGDKALEYIQKMGLSDAGILRDSDLSTGEVLITIDATGSASYVITEPVAWDAIPLTEATVRMVSSSDIFVFGSLACRSAQSRSTLEKLLEAAVFAVFDVNLRPPFYSMELLMTLISEAQFVKMNDEELIEITEALGGEKGALKERANWLLNEVSLDGLCITRGAAGALLFWEGSWYENPGYKVQVKDTVGAGDSFLATLIGGLLVKGERPEDALDAACAVGALVASKSGATCLVSESELRMMIPNP